MSKGVKIVKISKNGYKFFILSLIFVFLALPTLKLLAQFLEQGTVQGMGTTTATTTEEFAEGAVRPEEQSDEQSDEQGPSDEQDEQQEEQQQEEMLRTIEERQALEQELEELEKQIAHLEENITKTEKERKTLQNQIYLLKTKIQKLDLQIQQNAVMIRDITLQIEDTQSSIENTVDKIERLKQRITELLFVLYEKDQESPIEILLATSRLSDFFEQIVALETLHKKNQDFLNNIKKLKLNLEIQKKSLDAEREDLENLKRIQLLQKEESQITKKKQEQLLEKTKGEESKYQKLLQERQKRAKEIRARLFELMGIEKAQAPTFGEALELARYVEKITHVRPAFLLAVLTQESNIGKNVGQCYLTNTKTGEGINIRTGKRVKNVMKPMGLSGRKGDIDAFLQITEELGRKWNETPVSCPILSVGGYGGAMGPAQFIPTTWLLYRDRVSEIVGKRADPWSIKDAFVAAALYLADYGAAKQTYQSEWRAAMIYFSGSTKKKYRFYGDSVMAIAKQYEEDIKELEMNPENNSATTNKES